MKKVFEVVLRIPTATGYKFRYMRMRAATRGRAVLRAKHITRGSLVKVMEVLEK